MSGVVITLDDQATQAALGRLAAAGGALAPALASIGARLVSTTLSRFEQGRGPGGVPWKASRRALKQHGQTLIDSGRLRTSITFRLADPSTLEVGSNVVYAAIHQFGGTIRQGARAGTLRFEGNRFARQRRRRDGSLAPPGKKQRDRQVQFKPRSIAMPARPYLGFTAADRDDVLAIIARHLGRAAGA